MNTDDIRSPLRSMRDAFALTVAELTELRCYLAERYGDREPDPLAYLTEGSGPLWAHLYGFMGTGPPAGRD